MSITDTPEIPTHIWCVVGHKAQNANTMATTDRKEAEIFAAFEQRSDSDVRAVRYRLDEEVAS